MRRAQRGFTILELMVATAVMVTIATLILGVLSSQQVTYVGQERSLEAQEHARLVADVVLSDVRMAGLMVPRFTGIASGDGGASAADVLCTSDPDALSEGSLGAAKSRFDRARLSTNVAAGDDDVQLVVSDLDVDGDGDADFAVNRGIILGDGTNSHCARVVSITGGTLQFAPPSPFAFATGTGRVAPARIYEVGAGGLLRNAALLSRQVEDLQVEFGVDIDGNGQVQGGEFPIHDLSGLDPSLVRRVRVTVTTRSLQQDPNLAGQRPAAANRNQGPADRFRRRRVMASAVPRNLI